MTSFNEKLKMLLYLLQLYIISFTAYHLSLSSFINTKTGRMMSSSFAIFVALAVVADCSKLPESQVIEQLTESFYRMGEMMKQQEKLNNKAIADLSDAMHRLEVKFAKRDEEIKTSINQLEEKLSQTEVKTVDMREDFTKYKEKQGMTSHGYNVQIHTTQDVNK